MIIFDTVVPRLEDEYISQIRNPKYDGKYKKTFLPHFFDE